MLSAAGGKKFRKSLFFVIRGNYDLGEDDYETSRKLGFLNICNFFAIKNVNLMKNRR